MKQPSVLLLLSCLALSPSLVRAEPVAPGASPARAFTLQNGLHAILVPDPRAATVTVSAWYPAGPAFEKPGTRGISHLLERLSDGTAAGGTTDPRRLVEAEGGTSTAFTTADFTCYVHTVPAAALATVLRLEAGRPAAHLTQAMLDADRDAVRDELRAPIAPIERGLREMYAAAFADHPYRWPTAGSAEDLAKITLADCQAFLATRYAPDQALVVIVGDFDPDQASAEIRRQFEPLRGRAQGGPSPDATPAAAEPTGERRAVVNADVPLPIVAVGWRLPAGGTQDAPMVDLFSALLASGPEALLGDGSAPTSGPGWVAHTGQDLRRGASMFWAVSAARSVADTAAVERWLISGVEKLAGEPVSGEALDRARRQVEVDHLLNRQSTRDRAQAFGASQMIAGDWNADARRAQRWRTITPADLQRAAARTLVASRRTVTWVIPGGTAGGVGGRP